jgi:hypothetical protein
VIEKCQTKVNLHNRKLAIIVESFALWNEKPTEHVNFVDERSKLLHNNKAINLFSSIQTHQLFVVQEKIIDINNVFVVEILICRKLLWNIKYTH